MSLSGDNKAKLLLNSIDKVPSLINSYSQNSSENVSTEFTNNEHEKIKPILFSQIDNILRLKNNSSNKNQGFIFTFDLEKNSFSDYKIQNLTEDIRKIVIFYFGSSESEILNKFILDIIDVDSSNTINPKNNISSINSNQNENIYNNSSTNNTNPINSNYKICPNCNSPLKSNLFEYVCNDCKRKKKINDEPNPKIKEWKNKINSEFLKLQSYKGIDCFFGYYDGKIIEMKNEKISKLNHFSLNNIRTSEFDSFENSVAKIKDTSIISNIDNSDYKSQKIDVSNLNDSMENSNEAKDNFLNYQIENNNNKTKEAFNRFIEKKSLIPQSSKNHNTSNSNLKIGTTNPVNNKNIKKNEKKLINNSKSSRDILIEIEINKSNYGIIIQSECEGEVDGIFIGEPKNDFINHEIIEKLIWKDYEDCYIKNTKNSNLKEFLADECFLKEKLGFLMEIKINTNLIHLLEQLDRSYFLHKDIFNCKNLLKTGENNNKENFKEIEKFTPNNLNDDLKIENLKEEEKVNLIGLIVLDSYGYNNNKSKSDGYPILNKEILNAIAFLEKKGLKILILDLNKTNDEKQPEKEYFEKIDIFPYFDNTKFENVVKSIKDNVIKKFDKFSKDNVKVEDKINQSIENLVKIFNDIDAKFSADTGLIINYHNLIDIEKLIKEQEENLINLSTNIKNICSTFTNDFDIDDKNKQIIFTNKNKKCNQENLLFFKNINDFVEKENKFFDYIQSKIRKSKDNYYRNITKLKRKINSNLVDIEGENVDFKKKMNLFGDEFFEFYEELENNLNMMILEESQN